MILDPPWDGIMTCLLIREGGFVDDDDDPGDATKYGCTIATLNAWRYHPATKDESWHGQRCTVADVKALTRQDVIRIYWEMWIKDPALRLDLMAVTAHAFLVEFVLDTAILFGQVQAATWLQQAINHRRAGAVTVDGVIGEKTRIALATVDADAVIKVMVASRIRRHALRVRQKPVKIKFLEGWCERSLHWLTAK